MDLVLLISLGVIIMLYLGLSLVAFCFKNTMNRKRLISIDKGNSQEQIDYRRHLMGKREVGLKWMNRVGIALLILGAAVFLTWIVSRIVISYQ